jgi:hypothetical protein
MFIEVGKLVFYQRTQIAKQGAKNYRQPKAELFQVDRQKM